MGLSINLTGIFLSPCFYSIAKVKQTDLRAKLCKRMGIRLYHLKMILAITSLKIDFLY
jgi:hypothetical protein